MTTPLKPGHETSEETQLPNPSITTEEGSGAPPETPPKPSTNPLAEEIRSLNLSALSTLHREKEALEEENRQLRLVRENTVAKPDGQPVDMARFLEDPEGRVGAIVQAHLDRSIAPLKGFVDEFRANQNYERLKNQFRKNPKLGEVINNYESQIDAVMAGAPATAENLQATILNVLGAVTAGLIPEVTGVVKRATIDTTKPEVLEQPFINSSPPTAPRKENKVKPALERMTEEERVVAQRMGINPEEYVHLRDANPNDVSSWAMPTPEKK